VFVWGIDPGLSRCGYAVLEPRGRDTRVVAMGVFTTPPSDPVPRRLHALQRDVRELAAEHPPAEVAIERILFSVNVRTAIGVAQAAGVVMTEAVDAGAAVTEYSPNEIKQAVTGDGAADKQQVESMVQRLLRIEHPIRPVDAADAAAVALCHVAHVPMRARTARALGTAR
jgi:crossover junction endodeoxyribonuclease RuvC